MSPKMSLRYLFSIDYLFSTTGKLSYGLLYLLFFLAATVAGITYRILAKRKNDYIAKEDFVKQFFWIYVLWGALGLVSVFARAQNLPVFGARIFTIAIIFLFAISNFWLVIYHQKWTKKEIYKFTNKKRKEKWLKKK